MNGTDERREIISLCQRLDLLRTETKLNANLAFESGNRGVFQALNRFLDKIESVQICLNEELNES